MRDHAVLYLNGRRHDVRGPELLLPLSTWLRENQRLTGTKIVCAEGDCGACTLLVGRLDRTEADNRLTYRAIDSCIAFVYQMDRAHVVTIEGLREADGSLSAVQRAMVDCHGSQCGFCTPGFVATIHAVHEGQEIGGQENGDNPRFPQERDEPGTPEAANGGCPRFPAIDWPHALSGNLCRCTGYVQIFDACGAVEPGSLTALNDRYPPEAMAAAFAEAAEAPLDAALDRDGHGCRIAAPRTLDAAAAFRREHPACRIAAGTTDLGVQHRHGRWEPETVLSLQDVDGLDRIQREDNDRGSETLVIGAAATWSAVARELGHELPGFHEILLRFGSPQIRNAGTLAGNVANGSPVADSLPLLFVLGAEVQLASVAGGRRVPIDRFYTGYKRMDLRADELIAAVRIPLPTAPQRLSLHRVSKRHDMDISTFTAAVLVEVQLADRGRNGAETHMVRGARVALGGVAATVVRLPSVEAFLEGAAFTEDTFRQAGRLACDEVEPLSDVRGSAAYRLALCENVMVKAYFEIAEGAPP